MNLTLNGVCPYFTMYPLEFPLRFLSRQTLSRNAVVLDPFCGRGTTNFAARVLGVPSYGIDSSPVAVAIARAKVCRTTFENVVKLTAEIMNDAPDPVDIPNDDFWRLAYSASTLHQLCRLREELLRDCESAERQVVRAIVLGALHGPITKSFRSYLSNQCPRTYSPKPKYATNFWKSHRFTPPVVDLQKVVFRRAERFLVKQPDTPGGAILEGDSRSLNLPKIGFRYVITSPPYYGMRSYIPDQWLRLWFVGGPSTVTYGQRSEDFEHTSPKDFTEQLQKVWINLEGSCESRAKLVCRFGGIATRNVDPLELLKSSFRDTSWRVETIRKGGTASDGHRQAHQFGSDQRADGLDEYDLYATLN